MYYVLCMVDQRKVKNGPFTFCDVTATAFPVVQTFAIILPNFLGLTSRLLARSSAARLVNVEPTASMGAKTDLRLSQVHKMSPSLYLTPPRHHISII